MRLQLNICPLFPSLTSLIDEHAGNLVWAQEECKEMFETIAEVVVSTVLAEPLFYRFNSLYSLDDGLARQGRLPPEPPAWRKI